MQLSTDEARALAFIACLIGLALLGRWVDRPRPVVTGMETVDVAELRARSVASQGPARGSGRARERVREPAREAETSPGGRQSPRAREREGPVDLNRAGLAELESLPGVGPALAARIVAYRDSVGRFSRPEQLDSVKGVGPALLARLLPLVQVSP